MGMKRETTGKENKEELLHLKTEQDMKENGIIASYNNIRLRGTSIRQGKGV